MKIYKDILNALKIETVYIISGEILYMCIPTEIKGLTWYISTETDRLNANIILKVKFNGSFLYLQAKIICKKQDYLSSFSYELEIEKSEENKDNFKLTFFKMINEMEEKSKQWDKRKEKRYDIGLDENKIKSINFKSPEQIVVTDKIQLPCVVNNLSYSGAKVTTLEGNFSKDKKICLYLSFVQPIEQIPIIANVRNCYLKTTAENKILSVLSLKYEETPYEYKQRLDNFINIAEE